MLLSDHSDMTDRMYGPQLPWLPRANMKGPHWPAVWPLPRPVSPLYSEQKTEMKSCWSYWSRLREGLESWPQSNTHTHVYTHRESDAHCGREGSWNEFSLIKLHQQGGFSHSTVSHQDRLQENTHGHTLVSDVDIIVLEHQSKCVCVHTDISSDWSSVWLRAVTHSN